MSIIFKYKITSPAVESRLYIITLTFIVTLDLFANNITFKTKNMDVKKKSTGG